MVTQLPCDPETIAEHETPRWCDGKGVYLLIAMLALVFVFAV